MSKHRTTYYYEWPRPGVTVDIALFTVAGAVNDLQLQVLLIERDEKPWAGQWALPGGFVHENEDLHAAATRKLNEETGIRTATLEQVEAVGTPGRDTRGHIITIVYAGMTAGDRHELQPRGDARQARWFNVSAAQPLPALAFDHGELLARLAPPAPASGGSADLFRAIAGGFHAERIASVDGSDPGLSPGPPQLPPQGRGDRSGGAGSRFARRLASAGTIVSLRAGIVPAPRTAVAVMRSRDSAHSMTSVIALAARCRIECLGARRGEYMSPNLTTVLAAAQALPVGDRRELVEQLLDGLADTAEDQTPPLSEAWRQETAPVGGIRGRPRRNRFLGRCSSPLASAEGFGWPLATSSCLSHPSPVHRPCK